MVRGRTIFWAHARVISLLMLYNRYAPKVLNPRFLEDVYLAAFLARNLCKLNRCGADLQRRYLAACGELAFAETGTSLRRCLTSLEVIG